VLLGKEKRCNEDVGHCFGSCCFLIAVFYIDGDHMLTGPGSCVVLAFLLCLESTEASWQQWTILPKSSRHLRTKQNLFRSTPTYSMK